MTVSINLTAVLITFIICFFLYAICRIASKNEAKKEHPKGMRPFDINKLDEMHEIDIPKFVRQAHTKEGEAKQ